MNQYWIFTKQSDGRSYKTKNMDTGLCLDVDNGSTEVGATVLAYKEHDGDNQKWYIQGNKNEYRLRAKSGWTVLDLYGLNSNEGAGYDMYGSNDSYAQLFTITKLVDAPVIKTISFKDACMVAINSATSDATIYYTTDGTEPTTSSTKYTAPFIANKNTTVKAYAVASDSLDSNVITKEIVVTSDEYETIAQGTYKENTYLVFNNENNLAYNDAKAYCEFVGGHLATISSQEENDFITSLLTTEKKYYFIGSSDSAVEGVWSWITGEPFKYTNWAESQPDDSNGEDCGSIKLDGTWNDIPATQPCGFICEIEGEFDIPLGTIVTASANTSGLNLSNSADADISNLTLEDLNPTVIFAYRYGDGTIACINKHELNIGSKATVTVSDAVSNNIVELNNNLIHSVDVYVWNNFDSIVPMAYKAVDNYNYSN